MEVVASGKASVNSKGSKEGDTVWGLCLGMKQPDMWAAVFEYEAATHVGSCVWGERGEKMEVRAGGAGAKAV
eukprot:353072-Chlamydomonas_euryale.AAC.6